MSKVTKEMINAAHDVTMQSKLMLGHELLMKIYLAMDAQRHDAPAKAVEWAELNEQERNDIEDACEMMIGKPAFDAIEAKLKQKNGYTKENT